MMKNYEELIMLVVMFEQNDIVTLSEGDNIIGPDQGIGWDDN